MNKLLQRFLDALRDRIVASVASVVGSTFSSYRAAQQAEQQSFLEDLARRYEAEGKQALAEQLRNRAQNLGVDDPASEGTSVFENVLEDRRTLPALTDSGQSNGKADLAAPDAAPASKKRPSRKSAKKADDSQISLD